MAAQVAFTAWSTFEPPAISFLIGCFLQVNKRVLMSSVLPSEESRDGSQQANSFRNSTNSSPQGAGSSCWTKLHKMHKCNSSYIWTETHRHTVTLLLPSPGGCLGWPVQTLFLQEAHSVHVWTQASIEDRTGHGSSSLEVTPSHHGSLQEEWRHDKTNKSVFFHTLSTTCNLVCEHLKG